MSHHQLQLINMLSTAIAQPQIHQFLASTRSNLRYRRGVTRDCGTTHTRAHAARSADRIQTASDVQMGMYLNALDVEQELFDMDSDSDSDTDDDISLPTSNSLQADLHFARASEQLNRPQPPFVPVEYAKFNNVIDNYTNEETRLYFHLGKENLRRLFNAWHVPTTFRTNSGSTWTGEGAFLMYLRRLCTIIKFDDPKIRQEMGGRSRSAMSECCSTFQEWLFEKITRESLMSGSLNRWASQLPHWYRLIRSQAGNYNVNQHGYVVMFVDGTFNRTCRPGGWDYLQRVMYTRYKKAHGFGFLVVMAPNGLIIDCWYVSFFNWFAFWYK